jgi:hypothetical protein
LDDGSLPSLTLIATLVVIHGLFAMAFAALSASPASYLREQAVDHHERRDERKTG